jgi:hypothetical protein
LSSTDSVTEPLSQSFSLLDSEYEVSVSGKLHRRVTFTTSIRGRYE